MNVHTARGPSSALDSSHLGVEFPYKPRYGNYIGGTFVDPKSGQWFENVISVTGKALCEVARSNAVDIEAALDAAHAAA